MTEKKLRISGYLRPLLCDNGGGFSLGRLALWLTLAPALNTWWSGQDIKENHLYVLGFLLIYNSYKRMPMFIKLIRAWKGTDTNDNR